MRFVVLFERKVAKFVHGSLTWFIRRVAVLMVAIDEPVKCHMLL